MIILAFCLSLAIFSTPSIAEYIKFNAYLECNIPIRQDDYCVALRYYEEDTFIDDKIGDAEVTCGQVTKIESAFTFSWYDVGDGWLDNWYEFYADVKHSCNSDGTTRHFKHRFVPVPTWQPNIFLTMTLILDNYGTVVPGWRNAPVKRSAEETTARKLI